MPAGHPRGWKNVTDCGETAKQHVLRHLTWHLILVLGHLNASKLQSHTWIWEVKHEVLADLLVLSLACSITFQ